MTYCFTCGGAGSIERPTVTAFVSVRREHHGQSGDWYDNVEREVTSGGIDACPTCCKMAEIEWHQYRR
jgi:hypothetical protein